MLRVFFGFFGSPLTAHHSWVVGMSAARVNSSLEKDTLEHRLMMRLSVMAAGLLILLPSRTLPVQQHQPWYRPDGWV